MADFALVLHKKNEEQARTKNIFEKIAGRLKAAFKKPDLQENIGMIELYDNVRVLLFSLPYSSEELLRLGPGRLNDIRRFVAKVCADSGIKHCLCCRELQDILKPVAAADRFTGKLLYKSLLVNILEDIYTSGGIRIAGLDTTIVSGDSPEELYEVIRLLSPAVRYLTVVAQEREAVEKGLESIYEEAGLACMVTQDYANAFKNTDLMINLANLNEAIHSVKCRRKAVLLNYNEKITSGFAPELSVINGIDVRFPAQVLQKAGGRVFDLFSKPALAEVILLHKLEMHENHPGDRFELRMAERISAEFKKCGYGITGFTGRHHTVRVQDFRTG